MNYQLRKAEMAETLEIWAILQQAIIRRKKDGSTQWQDGYPNPEVVKNDIEKEIAFVLTYGKIIIGYCAVIVNYEPEYLKIEGKWLTNSDFVVIHRLAIAENYLGKNLSKSIIEFVEDFAKSNQIYSLKADTNHDNIAMMKIFEKTDFIFCGIVHFRGSPRRAYEKVL
ncbi:GNAT family N-acetyltransferase [Flavobacterium sp.]|uniref:GNAT family N-acetyltransferase n=1 Tax=Flavobacterium sp. TaxID=239 RepID=UPI00286DD3EA|nr:GNAT family N-acetyltransferase [Flavobacterium sp.]